MSINTEARAMLTRIYTKRPARPKPVIRLDEVALILSAAFAVGMIVYVLAL